ncbi:MerR family transcriptional regulator [Cochlodiniinecator piscidefendens]|uniref:MerR family transcriptional regulator n=1 Tax=Cochlodiniinecator piscidefendens TaxID=2715756 RepID=UPI001E3E0655|nr:MerR family transcriptional regulator [Cochlodiniinecator piscidefendens]
MGSKSADAFRTIREVAEWIDTPAHVLRFWESKFTQIKPVKRAGGRRYYRPADMLLIGGIKKLLHDDGMTIKGVQKILQSEGPKGVAAHSQPLEGNFDGAEIESIDVAPMPEATTPAPTAHPEVLETADTAEDVTPDVETAAPEPIIEAEPIEESVTDAEVEVEIDAPPTLKTEPVSEPETSLHSEEQSLEEVLPEPSPNNAPEIADLAEPAEVEAQNPEPTEPVQVELFEEAVETTSTETDVIDASLPEGIDEPETHDVTVSDDTAPKVIIAASVPNDPADDALLPDATSLITQMNSAKSELNASQIEKLQSVHKVLASLKTRMAENAQK